MMSCGFLCRCGCGQPCACGGKPIVRKMGFRKVERLRFGRTVTEWVITDLFEDGSVVPEGFDWVAFHTRTTGDAPLAAVHPAPTNENGHAIATCGNNGCRYALGHKCRHEEGVIPMQEQQQEAAAE